MGRNGKLISVQIQKFWGVKRAMADGADRIEKRKAEHIGICLNEQVIGTNVTTGLERYRFMHNALPEIDFAEIDLSTDFLGRKLNVPLLVSSMSGGTRQAVELNRHLAVMAERRGWALGVGSARAAVEHEQLRYGFRLRTYAPSIPILANLGAVQLNYGYGVDECRRAVDIVEADGLVLHLNSLQELFQPEGNVNFKHLLGRIETLCGKLGVPVGVKEVGWGINGEVAARLAQVGVAFIDVAGAGGTSWSQVEKHRIADPVLKAAAEAFADWGIPTSECIVEVRERLPGCLLVASGGLQTGVDAAKTIALGADLAGYGRTLLAPALDSVDSLDGLMARIEWELKAAMFGIGAGSISELKQTPALMKR
jgi:isopentenyl-diphosphate delta-isomerase